MTWSSETALIAEWAEATDDAAVAGYRLDMASDGDFAHFVAGYQDRDLGLTTWVNATDLSAGDTYYIRVRAYDTSGNVSVSSEVGSGSTLSPTRKEFTCPGTP